jgi:hypothetical protein
MKLKSLFSTQPLQYILLVIAIALLTLAVLAQANPGTELPTRDYGIFVYIGEQITHGKLPYRDMWDNKPPGIFYLNAVALWIGRGSRWGIWLVEFVSLFGATLLSFNLMKKLWGIWPAIFGVCIWLAGLNLTLQGGNFTEEYPLFFHFLALTVFIKLIEEPQNRFHNLLIGVLFSLSFLFRPNNALVEALLILMLALIQIIQRNVGNFLTHLLWITLGVLPPILVTLVYFWSHGLLQGLLDGAIFHNLAYSNTTLTSSSPLIAGFEYLKISAWVGLIGYAVLLFQLKKSFGNPIFPVLIFLLAGWPLAIILSDPAGRNYGHYFMNWLPFLALLSAFALQTIINGIPRITDIFQGSYAYAYIIFLIFAVASLMTGGRGILYQRAIERVLKGSIEMRSTYSIYVENHTNPGEYVLFWAHLPGENFMANREAPYSTLPYPTLVDSNTTMELNDDFLRDILEHPPVLIVDMGRLDPLSLDPVKRAEQRKHGIGWSFPPHNLEEVFSFIEKNYFLEAEIKGKSVYRLYGTQAP